MRTILSCLAVVACAACVSDESVQSQPYLAVYERVESRPGDLVTYPTASLSGRLQVVNGCYVVRSDDGTTITVAFAPHVRAVRVGERWGLQDVSSGRRLTEGDRISIGGAEAPEPEAFIAERLRVTPPASCPNRLFVSNSSFKDR